MKNSVLENYADLFAKIMTVRETTRDKLKILEINAKCLYVPTHREESLELQTEIQACKSLLEKLEIYCNDIAVKYRNIAVSLCNNDAELFSMLFFSGMSPKDIAVQKNLSVDTVNNKKYKFMKIIREKLKQEEEE